MAGFNKCIFLKEISVRHRSVYALKFAIEFFETL